MTEYDLLDGRYRLLTELGSGAFGSVHRAAHVVMGQVVREVAIKVFHGDQISPENMHDKMNDAFQLLAILATMGEWRIRQHFLTIYDLGVSRETPPRAYIVMELVQGGNLASRIKHQTRFTLAGCLHYLRQICRAVAFMHQRRPPMVHSDLKPENILLFCSEGDDQVKIGDFGLAGFYRGPLEAGPRGGTMSYLAPEMFYNLATTPAADVYSLGLIAREMLTGANPFATVGSTLASEPSQGREMLHDMHRDARAQLEPLRREDFLTAGRPDQESPSLASLIDVINGMLESDLRRRYRHAGEVSAELERIAGGGMAIGRPGAAAVTSPRETGAASSSPGASDAPVFGAVERISQRFEHALAHQLWPAAGEAVRELDERARGGECPLDLPFRCKARLFRAQAAAIPALAARFLKQAAQELERGLGSCLAPDERTRLDEDLTLVRKELGIPWR